jgi:hypothetical protein
VAVVNEYLPEIEREIARKVVAAPTIEEVGAVVTDEPPGLIADIVSILSGLSEFSVEQVQGELDRLGG